METKMVGISLVMSFSENRTYELWKNFMPRRREIMFPEGTALYSIEIYSEGFFNKFDPQAPFEKWATIEVSRFGEIPDGFSRLIIPRGEYAVFVYRGLPSRAEVFYSYIYSQWLPSSGYSLDNRPHFAKMGEKYRSEDPSSEEEMWIPVKKITQG